MPDPGRVPAMRRAGVAAVLAGVVLLAGTALWSALAVSALVKFPLSTDTTLHYRGSFVTYLNSTTGQRLATPSSVPLLMDRLIKAVPSSSTSNVAIVKEDITLHYSGHVVHEDNVYALDRSSMCNVANRLACTFAPGNPAPSTGSYYITLPMNIVPGVTKLRIWKPETGTTYPLHALTGKREYSTIDGLRVAWFSGVLPMTPVASYERTSLAARGLPMTLSPTAVEAELSADDVSVPALSAALLPVLSPTQTAEVEAVLSRPVTLHYYAFGSGLLAAQTRTGAIIKLQGVTDGIAVSPDTSGLRTLITVLSAHQSVAGVPAALAALRHLASAPPQPVYELRYTQTPASVAGMVGTTQSQLRQITVVTYVVPIVAGVLGVLLLGAGVLLLRRRPPAPASGTGTSAVGGGGGGEPAVEGPAPPEGRSPAGPEGRSAA